MSIHANDDGTPNTVTYLCTDNYGNRIEELPITGSSFSLVLNGAGQFTGTLNVNDPKVQSLNWQAATAPNLAQLWVDIGGTLVYGGRVTKRTYTQQSGTVQVQAQDHWSYLSQRLQAKDYTSTWATSATGAAQIARTVIADALAVTGSLPISVSTPQPVGSGYGITLSAPASQRMTIDSIVNQLSSLGWQVGFDFAIDVQYVAGVPTATITLSYPRRGRVAGTTGLVIDVSTATAFTHDEDGGQQADSVHETATGVGGVSASGSWAPAMQVDGYPLLERVGIHSSFSTAATPASVMNAYVANDLALSAYPLTTPQVTVPLFGNDLSIGDFIVGDDVRVIVPRTSPYSVTVPGADTIIDGGTAAQSGPQIFAGGSTGALADGNASAGSIGPIQTQVPADPRFPNGMDFYWRIVRADVTLPTEGVATMQLTLNIPPSTTPQRPPH